MRMSMHTGKKRKLEDRASARCAAKIMIEIMYLE